MSSTKYFYEDLILYNTLCGHSSSSMIRIFTGLFLTLYIISVLLFSFIIHFYKFIFLQTDIFHVQNHTKVRKKFHYSEPHIVALSQLTLMKRAGLRPNEYLLLSSEHLWTYSQYIQSDYLFHYQHFFLLKLIESHPMSYSHTKLAWIIYYQKTLHYS